MVALFNPARRVPRTYKGSPPARSQTLAVPSWRLTVRTILAVGAEGHRRNVARVTAQLDDEASLWAGTFQTRAVLSALAVAI